jgi:glycogen operon protein
MRITPGAPEPLGATLDAEGANVAVFSSNAEEIHLCLFDAENHETRRIRLPARSGDVFHGHVAGLTEGQRYGLRAYGPDAPAEGHRFNGAKLLIDPYARALDRPVALHPAQFAHGATAGDDSAPFVAKAVMTRPRAAAATRPKHRWRDTIIYELSVKGFTATHPGAPEHVRGAFAGLAHPAVIAHFTRLGVTTLELLPCAAWIDERHLPPLGLSNYWGYNPIAFMAPDPRLAPGGWDEVRETVEKLHAAGLEVIVDVVFNHTGESDEYGPTLSLRGLDNAGYYRLAPDRAHYVNDAGCGNILAFEGSPVVRLAMDALRAWAIYGGVDGFRFDLATTLGRRPEGFDPHAPFLSALLQDPVLRDLKLIAEPWDLGPGGYRLGAFPAPFTEWNDRFRDSARRFWRGEACGVADLATRLAGSQDFFARRDPTRSVNFITAHDGFTLADLVAHAEKRNHANGEDNRDGTNDNLSWNNGAEGETDDPAIRDARHCDQRALLATLLLARGTPMLSMGAELGHSQGGNNNAYAQDNAIGWLDWARADTALFEATARLIDLRKAHVSLRGDRFLDGGAHDDSLLPDVEWRTPSGAPMNEDDWRRGDAQTLVASFAAEGNRTLVILHRGATPVEIALPPPRAGRDWRVAFDAADTATDARIFDTVTAAPRTVLLLVEEIAATARAPSPPEEAQLARLADAAGIAAHWRDVDGATHATPRETLLALLESVGLEARTRDMARDALVRLAARRDDAPLPAHVVTRANTPARLRLSGRDGAPARLSMDGEDGSETSIEVAALAPRAWRGCDGRERRGFVAELSPLPAGRYDLRLDDGGPPCRLIVAPSQCFTPEDARRDFGFSAQLYSMRRDGEIGRAHV